MLFEYYRHIVPAGKRVLEIGCGTGELLNAVHPSYGLGVDVSSAVISCAREKFPNLHFSSQALNGLDSEQPFDYILVSGTLGECPDIQEFLNQLRRFCAPHTRIIIEYYSYLWQLILKLAEKLHLKMPQKTQNWFTANDLRNFFRLTDYENIRLERRILFPLYIPLLSPFLNKIAANLPLLNAFTLNHFMIARLKPETRKHPEYSVSIIIPCRNERGNIEPAVRRTPVFGKNQEFIFVEGGSQDGSYEEVQRIIEKYGTEKDIRAYRQPGKGKADAVWEGFRKANGNILMILDADLTVAPETLPKFYHAIQTHKGEFINGCRLVYPMEKEAMRTLNLIANKFFGILFSWLLGQPLKDTLCGTKVLFRDHYETFVRSDAGFSSFDPFGDFALLFGAAKSNLKILELPIHYKERRYGSTQIRRFYHGLFLFKMSWVAMRKFKFF